VSMNYFCLYIVLWYLTLCVCGWVLFVMMQYSVVVVSSVVHCSSSS